jgi:hypothetical protein
VTRPCLARERADVDRPSLLVHVAVNHDCAARLDLELDLGLVYLGKKKKKVQTTDTKEKKIACSARLPSVREEATRRILSPGVQRRMKTGRGGSIGPENPSPH